VASVSSWLAGSGENRKPYTYVIPRSRMRRRSTIMVKSHAKKRGDHEVIPSHCFTGSRWHSDGSTSSHSQEIKRLTRLL
jgi:hypothetical protein